MGIYMSFDKGKTFFLNSGLPNILVLWVCGGQVRFFGKTCFFQLIFINNNFNFKKSLFVITIISVSDALL